MNEVIGLDRDVMGVVFVFSLMIFPLGRFRAGVGCLVRIGAC